MTTGASTAREEGVIYSHTQTGWWMLLVMGVVLALVAATSFGLPVGRRDPAVGALVMGVVGVILLFTVICFSTLNVRVTAQQVRWKFGPGPLGGRIALADIESVEPTRTSLAAGLGIHWIGRGWVYNVSGRDAVMIVERGGKTTWVGTDEPEALAAAIERARGR